MRFWTNSLFAVIHAAAIVAGLSIPAYLLAGALFGDGTASGKTFLDILPDVAHWPSLLGNTAAVCGIAAATAVGLGLILAPLLFRTDLPGRQAAIAILLMATCMPMYVTGTALLSVVGIARCQNSLIAAGLLYGVVLLAPATLLIGIGLRGVDPSCEEAAFLDAGAAKVVRHVSFPMARWSMLVAVLLVVFLAGTDYFLTDILQVRTFAEEVYTQYALRGTAQVPIMLSVPLMLALVAMGTTAFVCRPRPVSHTSTYERQRPGMFLLGRWRSICAMLVTGTLLALGGIPLGSIVRHVGSLGGFVEGCRAVLPEFVNSVWTCLVAASVCAALSIGIAWVAVRTRHVGWAARIFIVGLLAVPAPVVGITLIEMMNRPGLLGAIYDSPVMLIVGHVARFLPLAVLFMVPAVERVPRELEESARIDGCDSFALHRFVYWPLCFRDLRITWLLVLAFTFGETACSVLVAPPGWLTLSVRFFTLIHYGIYRDAAVVCILTVMAIMVPWFLLTRFERLFQENEA
ncbi:MAG: iron ABC transporter permease [Planctomycetes bacterium]|nr:iron ABC transporter permease [Planctomycetota bacterium]